MVLACLWLPPIPTDPHPNTPIPTPPLHHQCVTGRVPDWHAADTWSLGVCLYMLLTGRPLYRDPEDVAFTLLAQGGAPGLLHFYARYDSLTRVCNETILP